MSDPPGTSAEHGPRTADKRHYIACLDLEGRPCLVVGGGPVALEKTNGLLTCGAQVTVVAPEAVPELLDLPVDWLRRCYRSSDLDGQFLVVAATPDRLLNRRVFHDAEQRLLFCNVVDTPELGSFILPAIHRRGPIALAVSTGGASPVLAKRLRDGLGASIGQQHVALAERLRDLRPWARLHYPTRQARQRFFEALVDEELR